MKNKRLLAFFIIVLPLLTILLLLNQFGVDTTKVDIRGYITNISISDETMTILVEGEVKHDTSLDKGYMTINRHTKIFKDNKKVKKEELKVGDFVEAAYDGAIMESYPVQGTAKFITILE